MNSRKTVVSVAALFAVALAGLVLAGCPEKDGGTTTATTASATPSAAPPPAASSAGAGW